MFMSKLSKYFTSKYSQSKLYVFASCYHTGEFHVYGHKSRAKFIDQQSVEQIKENEESHENRIKHSNVYRLVEAYRKHGHKKANLDPLGLKQPEHVAELDIRRYGLDPTSTNKYDLSGIYNGNSSISIGELITELERLYCGHLTAEFSYLETEEEREWFAEAYESETNSSLSDDRKVNLAHLMLKCQTYDNFLANKFTTVKRYGGEGGESMMGIFDEIFHQSSLNGVTNIVMCMPHRGRLNLLACMLKFPPVVMFQKMKGKSELPRSAQGTGDVLSHLYTSVDLEYNNNNLHISLIPNPSHLEANNPVAVGKARAKQQWFNSGEYTNGDVQLDDVLCVQVHGDASFSAQGIISETFSFAECPHFNVGGSVHVIVNNQIGFTTESERGRSSRYSSDLAKINGYPVLHVNADNPEEVVKATSLAMRYRQKFKKDVLIDFICYRRWGHNELDDPTFTQPVMYNAIHSRKSIPDTYKDKIIGDGLCKEDLFSQSIQEWNTALSKNMSQVDSYIPQAFHLQKQWSSLIQPADSVTSWDTGMSVDILKFIGVKSVETPSNLKSHPTIQKTHIDRRAQKMVEGKDLDWSTAEALAFGSLLYQGFNVRISGQDVGRGTFSHRHVMIVDQDTDALWVPLNNLLPEQKGFLEVANSSLSEEAVLGFEYGMSIESPKSLIIWEAQFGDFFNGAQIIIDTYITSGENKWLLQSGLVMLLPHGMDGAGPEHSSCRIERFLQMCDSKEDRVDGDNINIQIVNPTTPAQYFHLLRRQMVRNFRKPLIVVAPKVLLRLPAATSSLSDMSPGTTFHPVLGDPGVKGEKVNKVIFCSGKHFYTLQKERESRKLEDVALIRLESLCPFPTAEIQSEMKKYQNAKDFVWSQEEHRNMGAWNFVAPRFENLIGCKLRYVGRDHLGAPATGIGDVHKSESQKLLDESFI